MFSLLHQKLELGIQINKLHEFQRIQIFCGRTKTQHHKTTQNRQFRFRGNTTKRASPDDANG